MDPDGPSRANQLRPLSAGFRYVQNVAIRISLVTRLYQLLGDCEYPPAACILLCVRFADAVSPPDATLSSQSVRTIIMCPFLLCDLAIIRATLDILYWLGFQ